ncbi:MAG: hypothetical protein AMXMBFR7_21330 [Planctomycetota bacterium]
MHRTCGLVLVLVCCASVCGGAEEAAAPVAESAKAPVAGWPVALKPGPLLAKVSFVDGRVVEKCWVEMQSLGAWVVIDGTRYWYLRAALREVTILDEEPDEALKKSLEMAQDKHKAELERQREADEARAKAEAEAAEAGVAMGDGAATGDVSEPANPAATGGGTKRGEAGKAATAKDAQAARNDANRTARAAAGSGDVQRVAGTGGGGSGDGPGPRAGDGVSEREMVLIFQWRVKDIDRKDGTITLRNRGLQKNIKLEVGDPADLTHVKRGDILVGSLTQAEPQLTAKDGTPVEFQPFQGAP